MNSTSKQKIGYSNESGNFVFGTFYTSISYQERMDLQAYLTSGFIERKKLRG